MPATGIAILFLFNRHQEEPYLSHLSMCPMFFGYFMPFSLGFYLLLGSETTRIYHYFVQFNIWCVIQCKIKDRASFVTKKVLFTAIPTCLPAIGSPTTTCSKACYIANKLNKLFLKIFTKCLHRMKLISH